jgi:hypothetical protein
MGVQPGSHGGLVSRGRFRPDKSTGGPVTAFDPSQRVARLVALSSFKRKRPVKRLIVIAATILAVSTPAFTQNTEQENNAAMAAVIYMIAQKRCNLTTGEDGKLRGMTVSVIESHGFSWEKVVYGEKPMIDAFLKDNPVYAKATSNDPAAVKTVCNGARAMLARRNRLYDTRGNSREPWPRLPLSESEWTKRRDLATSAIRTMAIMFGPRPWRPTRRR